MFGEQVLGVYGICKIRNFEEMIVNINCDAMTYVNIIADVVHSQVFIHNGVANKNLGDTFVLIWREPDTEEEGIRDIRDISDLSLIGTLKIFANLNTFTHVREIAAKANANSSKKVEIGFALHFGLAIEGAIGSQSKIDASYVGATLIAAHQLVDATEVYNVNIIVSGDLYSSMSPTFKDFLRVIDYIKIEEISKPIKLYTLTIE